MKWITILLILTLLVCSSGIASAANNSTMTLFTDENMQNAEDTMVTAGLGDMFALISIIIIIAIWVAPVVLLATAIVAKVLHKNDLYKDALIGFAMLVGVLVVYNLYVAFIGSMSPDISSIKL